MTSGSDLGFQTEETRHVRDRSCWRLPQQLIAQLPHLCIQHRQQLLLLYQTDLIRTTKATLGHLTLDSSGLLLPTTQQLNARWIHFSLQINSPILYSP